MAGGVNEEDFGGAGDFADASDAGFGFAGERAKERGAFGRDGEEEGVVFAAVEGELEGIETWRVARSAGSGDFRG